MHFAFGYLYLHSNVCNCDDVLSCGDYGLLCLHHKLRQTNMFASMQLQTLVHFSTSEHAQQHIRLQNIFLL